MGWFSNEKRLRDLEDRLFKAERSLQAVLQEWDDTLHRVSRLMGRIAKTEARIADRANNGDAEAESTAGAIDLTPASPMTMLTMRGKRVQAQIAAMRRAKGIGA